MENCRRSLELCAKKSLKEKYSMLCDLLCRSLEGNNVEGNVKYGGLVCKGSEGILKTLSGPLVILNEDSVVLVN